MNNKELNQLCIKSITGNINDHEKKALDQWISKSESNKKEYENLESLWKSTVPDKLPEFPLIEEEWLRLNERIRSIEVKDKLIESPVKRIAEYLQFIFIPKLRPVVSGVIILFFIVSGIILLNQRVSFIKMDTVTTAKEERLTIHLPDGSIINLNERSQIQYPESFSKNIRDVKLNGEAFFSVAKNGSPFVITTGNAKVTVLGTKFDVWNRGEQTEVFVKEGKVKLANNASEPESVKLLSGQMGTITKEDAPIAVNTGFNFLPGWINGKLEFNHTRLAAIIDELDRYYNVQIKLDDPELDKLSLTGTFKDDNVDIVLNKICLALDLKYKRQNGIYIIN